jgi:hypothetical protein
MLMMSLVICGGGKGGEVVARNKARAKQNVHPYVEGGGEAISRLHELLDAGIVDVAQLVQRLLAAGQNREAVLQLQLLPLRPASVMTMTTHHRRVSLGVLQHDSLPPLSCEARAYWDGAGVGCSMADTSICMLSLRRRGA